MVPEMLLLAFLFLLETTFAADLTHLKPGNLSAHLGRTFLVKDVLWIKYPFPTLVEVPTYLTVITEQLDAVLSQLEDNFPEEVVTSGYFLFWMRG